MAKGISKDRVIETALTLIDQGETKINFRDIARELNCAHTNLYNYFDSFDALLWEAQETIMLRLQSDIENGLNSAAEPEAKLAAFFRAFVDFYLAHKGWFALAWFASLGSPRPKHHYDLTVSTVDDMIQSLSSISRQMSGKTVSEEEMRFMLHNVHCYIIGELSIYFSGRSLLRDEAQFRTHVNTQAAKMMLAMLLSAE